MALLGTAPTTYIETDLKFNCTKGPELLSNTERELTIAEFNFVDKVNIYMTCQIKSCQKKCHMVWAQQFSNAILAEPPKGLNQQPRTYLPDFLLKLMGNLVG